MKHTKVCKKCKCVQTYNGLGNYNRAVKNDTLCRNCNNKEVSLKTKEKISKALKGKPKAIQSVGKMKNSLIELWKNKSEDELNEWKQIVSQTSIERWKDIEYKTKVSNSVKKHWSTLSTQERESRYMNQQNAGAGICEYMMVNDYKVYGTCEQRYIKSLYKNNNELPFNKERSGIKTPFGICFPDFEYETHFIEIKSTYTFNKMIEERTKTEKCQLGKLMWISNNVKEIKILVETSRNKFEDKTKIAILKFI